MSISKRQSSQGNVNPRAEGRLQEKNAVAKSEISAVGQSGRIVVEKNVDYPIFTAKSCQNVKIDSRVTRGCPHRITAIPPMRHERQPCRSQRS